MKRLLSCLALCSITGALSAADLRVDPQKGDDKADGSSAPVRSIARAISLAKAGDTVHLTPGAYFESVNLVNKTGAPGQPIVIDGHGAWIDGSDPVRADEWESLGLGLFRKVKLIPRMGPAIIGRWFFLWNGQMNRMGRSSKGRSQPLKPVAELLANEWTYVEAEDAFYLKLPEGQTLDQAKIRCPVRANGVALAGKGGHIVVRNLNCTHVYNDGFNIHGDQVDTVYENITAIECGDDGFSAHETAECRIDGFVSRGNSTGLCDVGSSVTHYRNVEISGCSGHDVFFLSDSAHSLENARVESMAFFAFTVGQHASEVPLPPSKVLLKNVHVIRSPGIGGEFRVNRNCVVEASRCTFENMKVNVTPGGSLSLDSSVVRGGEIQPEIEVYAEAVWVGQGNVYDIRQWRQGPRTLASTDFSAYQQASGQEAGSEWRKLRTEESAGASTPLSRRD